MTPIYLNQAEGIRPPMITEKISRRSALNNSKILEKEIRKILGATPNDFLAFSQNITTSLINVLLPILNKTNYEIYICSHEIRWFKTLFKIGTLPTHETTYPNYARQEEVAFIKRKINIIDPADLINNPAKKIGRKDAIIIFSHVSRLTGEIIASQKLYREIKKINPNNIIIVDGAQAIGAMPVKAKSLSDVYIGTSSKFIGAEPLVAFCWVSKALINNFLINVWSIDPIKFCREVYSSISALKKLIINPKITSKHRNELKLFLKTKNLSVLEEKAQAPHIAIIPWKRSLVEKKINDLRKSGYIISSNIGYSIKEPEISGLRVSLTPQTTAEQLKQLVTLL
ncbi:MAG: aminotransferase class V-fold PLP-dependent enzyme [Patescibacteria group bacterium]